MPRLRSSRTHNRSGFANLEFTLTLPLVVILLGAIVTGAYVLMTRLILSHTVRREAWTQRHGTPPPGTLPIKTFTDMGILPGIPESQGKITVDQTKQLHLPSIFRDRQFHTRMDHNVMGSSWDYQTIPFVPRGPLQPDPRLSVYSPGVSPAVLSALAAGFNMLGL